eukprot:TRINITY_DN2640_c0_g1_i1.p1 TRINITY_DN2640_c0_g1~~TRINITY_DN2640_c0_g1_i1.p1  ORF type:complete len:193 (-),score=30.90 TRINITY_DN2640_c0_g1_i1:583-1161(-)
MPPLTLYRCLISSATDHSFTLIHPRILVHRNPHTNNMCSKCYRDVCKAAPSAPLSPPTLPVSALSSSPSTASSIASSSITSSSITSPSTASSSIASSSVASSSIASPAIASPAIASPALEISASPKTVPANRCFSCRRKVGLTGFKCRCDNVFCGDHRYADKHECPFDYKAHDRSQLEKANPAVVGAKIQKI